MGRDALTRDFDLHQWKDLEYENGNPAERIGDDNGEEAFGNGQLFLNVVAVFGRLRSCSLDIVKHASIRQYDDEKSHQIETYLETGYVFDMIYNSEKHSSMWKMTSIQSISTTSVHFKHLSGQERLSYWSRWKPPHFFSALNNISALSPLFQSKLRPLDVTSITQTNWAQREQFLNHEQRVLNNSHCCKNRKASNKSQLLKGELLCLKCLKRL